MNYQKMLSEDAERANQILLKYLPYDKTAPQNIICESMKYSCMAGGKRLRPILMLETYRMYDGTDTAIEPFMAAIEMIHTYSLVHDDLPCMDNDLLRRGKKTTWSKYGENIGVLCGDALLGQAFEIAAATFTQENYRNVSRAIQILSKKAGVNGMLGGQVVDVTAAGKPLHRNQLEYMYELKTSAMLESAMMIGAVLAGVSDEETAFIEKVASKVGMAFQIRDDLLDVIGSATTIGKSVGSDAKNSKSTYVTINGLIKSQNDIEKLMNDADKMLADKENSDVLRYLFKTLISRKK